MKKFLLSIFAVMLAVFSVQAEEIKYSFSSYETGTQYAQGERHTLDENVTLIINGAHLNDQVRLYAGSNAVFESKRDITKVVLNAGYKVGTLTVNVSDDGSTWTKVKEQSTTTSYTAYTFDLGGSYKYVQMVSTGAQIRVSIATLTFSEDAGGEGGETPEPDQPEAPVAPTLPTSCNFDNSMKVEITNIADGATAYYTTNGTTPSATNGTEYTAPFEITATTTVMAIAVNEGGSSEVASATYTKNEPVTPPSGGEVVGGEVVDVLNRELTGVTKNSTNYSSWSGKTATSSAVYAGQSAGGNDAIQLRTTNNNSGIVTTKSGGKVKKISIVWNDATGSRTLNIYGKNSPYTSPEDLYKTDKQGELLGQITKATGRATYIEVDGDYEYIGLRSNSSAMFINEISITWEASADVTPVAPAAPVLTGAQTFKGSMFVTITSDATVYYTTDGTTPSATNGTEYTAPFEITATTTVKAVAVNEVGESEVAEATYTLLVVEETEGYYVKVTSEPADWTGKYLVVYEDGANAYVFNGKDQANGYVAATIDGAVIKANSELDAVAVTIATMEGGYSIMTADGYISGTASANKLNFSTTEQLNTIAMGTDGVDINAGRYLRFNSAAGDMRFRYYNITYGKSVQLYKYVAELPSYTLTVGETEWATLYLDFAVTIPAGVEVWTVSEIVDGYVVLGEVLDVIPAGCPVLVKASMSGDYEFAYTAETGNEYVNLLQGTAVATYITDDAYVLTADDTSENGVCFGRAIKNQLDGTAWLNNANKAYLPASVANGAASYSFRFEEGTTGIENVEVENEVKAIFDLTGRRVEEITAPGVYIVNGVKRVVR